MEILLAMLIIAIFAAFTTKLVESIINIIKNVKYNKKDKIPVSNGLYDKFNLRTNIFSGIAYLVILTFIIFGALEMPKKTYTEPLSEYELELTEKGYNLSHSDKNFLFDKYEDVNKINDSCEFIGEYTINFKNDTTLYRIILK